MNEEEIAIGIAETRKSLTLADAPEWLDPWKLAVRLWDYYLEKEGIRE